MVALPALSGVVALASFVLLLWVVPLHLSEPLEIVRVNQTREIVLDLSALQEERIAFEFNLTLPDDFNPKDYRAEPGLLFYNKFVTNGTENLRPEQRRFGILEWINLSINGQQTESWPNNNVQGINYGTTSGVPRDNLRAWFQSYFHPGPNTVRYDVTISRLGLEPVEGVAVLTYGPIDTNIREMDRDGDGVSNRYQVLDTIPAATTAILLGLVAGMAAYLLARRALRRRFGEA